MIDTVSNRSADLSAFLGLAVFWDHPGITAPHPSASEPPRHSYLLLQPPPTPGLPLDSELSEA